MIQLEHAQIVNKSNGGFYEKLSESVDIPIRWAAGDGIWNHDFLNWPSDYLKNLHKRQIRCWK